MASKSSECEAGSSVDGVRDRYTFAEFLWIPALGGISVTALAIYKFASVKNLSDDTGLPVVLILGLFFVSGCVGSLPLMLSDSIARPWLRKLVLWTGVLLIVSVIVGLALMTKS